MTMVVQGPGGMSVEFPDGTDPGIIDKVMRSAVAPDQPSTAMDVLKSAGTGVAKGVIGLAGLPGLAKDAIDAGLDYGISKGLLPQPSATPQQRAVAHASAPDLFPRSENMQRGIERVTGEFHKPETQAGRYAETIGEFAPNAIVPGGIIRRAAQVVAPAVASEYAGQQVADSQYKKYEPLARVAAALVGGLGATGVEASIGRARSTIPGVSPGASRVLDRGVSPDAPARLDELGPQAFLFEGSEPTLSIAKGIAVRPGPAQEMLVTAVKDRNKSANARLTGDLDANLGQAVSPARIEQSLDAQRATLHPLYEQVAGLNEPVNLRGVFDQLRAAIPQESGHTQSALRRVMDMVAPTAGAGGQRTVRTSPREVLNVRQALDDELIGLAEKYPKAHRAVNEYRRQIDERLADAVPDIKVLDATYSNLMRESEAMTRGGQIFRTGPEAIRPEDLIAERGRMTLPQREAMRMGTRAEIDRVVGTRANDVVALKQMVMADGDWSRVKLAEIFGGREADRILKSIDREAAFQSSYKALVENSQTAARLLGEKALPTKRVENADLKGTTLFGTLLSGGQWAVNSVRNAAHNAQVSAVDSELAKIMTTTGSARDRLIADIGRAQRTRKKYQTPTRDMLVRALMNANAAREK